MIVVDENFVSAGTNDVTNSVLQATEDSSALLELQMVTKPPSCRLTYCLHYKEPSSDLAYALAHRLAASAPQLWIHTRG